MLESLVFGNLVLLDSASLRDHFMRSGKLDVKTATQLKSLSITIDALGRYNMMEFCNRLFHYILESCPVLEEFKLKGYLGADGGALDPDFRENNQLKYFEIDVEGCGYYTFNGDSDLEWKTSVKKCCKKISTDLSSDHKMLTLSIWLGPKVAVMMPSFNWLMVQLDTTKIPSFNFTLQYYSNSDCKYFVSQNYILSSFSLHEQIPLLILLSLLSFIV